MNVEVLLLFFKSLSSKKRMTDNNQNLAWYVMRLKIQGLLKQVLH